MTKYTKVYNVRSLEMDSEYLLKKMEVSRYFQETFALYCKDKKLAAFDIVDQNLFWVVSEMHIEFTGEMPFWSEEVSVTVWVSEITKLRIYVDFEINYKGKIIAKGDSLWFILNSNTRRPINPTELLKDFEVYNEPVFGEHSKFGFEEKGTLLFEKDYKVGIFDLDFNHHMNNIKYTAFAINTVSNEYLATHEIQSYKIKFIKECFLDDEIKCQFFESKEHSYFIQTRKSDNAVVCKIETIAQNK